ncbi:transposase (plasmid) [Streptomyces europaeiscabiei]|nr:transposase [Streptomyces europaeiscabiei]
MEIARQLNKGESLHSLRRSLLNAHEGAIRHRHLAAQTEQAWFLALLSMSMGSSNGYRPVPGTLRGPPCRRIAATPPSVVVLPRTPEALSELTDIEHRVSPALSVVSDERCQHSPTYSPC